MQELRYFIRLVKGDVRIGMGVANVLPALGDHAHASFKALPNRQGPCADQHAVCRPSRTW